MEPPNRGGTAMVGLRVAIRAVFVALLMSWPLVGSAEGEVRDDQAEVTQVAAAADAEAAADPKPDPESAAHDELEDLVVTARRRPELLQETPVAATVLGGELLQQRGVDSLEEIGVYVPNLTAFSGVTHQGTFYSRGVGQRDAIVTLDPGVGIYVDDVYVARAHGALLP